MTDQQKPAILLAHGAWHRPLHYRPLIDALRAKGFTVLAPPLATSGYDDSLVGKTINDDVKRLHDAALPLFDQGKTVLGVGHSLGGVSLTAAFQGQTIAERAGRGLRGGFAGVVYISAIPIFEKGISMYEAAGGKYTTAWFHDVTETRLPLKLDKAKEAFYNDIEPSVQDEAVRYVCDQSTAAMEAPIVCTPIDLDIPKLFVICTKDAILSPEIQAYTAGKWAARTAEVEAGHSPWMREGPRARLVEIIDADAANVK